MRFFGFFVLSIGVFTSSILAVNSGCKTNEGGDASKETCLLENSPTDNNMATTKVSTAQEKVDAVKNPWWHSPMQALFPDKRFDGQFQNPNTQNIFDFDDVVMKADDPVDFVKTQGVYYPPQDDQNLFTIFIPGLGQTEAIASQRSCRYAERLNTGITNLNNGSFLKQNPLLTRVNPLLDWLDATVHRLGMSKSYVIDNSATFLLWAIDHKQVINLSADSHGTILLGRALWKTKDLYMKREAPFFFSRNRAEAEKQWEALSQEYINVVCFGNGYINWVKGPKYVMVNFSTDPLTKMFGLTLERAKKRDDVASLIFESIFEEGNFEAHNMMYTIEVLRQTFVKNDMTIGDFSLLYKKLQDGSLDLVTADEALSSDFPWPDDMKDYTWDPSIPLPGQK